MPDTPEGRLQQLGIKLPEQLPVLATYRLARRHRDIVYVAGHPSATLDGSDMIRGKAGAGLTLEQAQQAARACALQTCIVTFLCSPSIPVPFPAPLTPPHAPTRLRASPFPEASPSGRR